MRMTCKKATSAFGKQHKINYFFFKRNQHLLDSFHHILNKCLFCQKPPLLFKILHTQVQEAGCTKLNLKLLSELLYVKFLWLVISWLVHALSSPSGILKLNLKLSSNGSQKTALRFRKQDFLFGHAAAILTLS